MISNFNNMWEKQVQILKLIFNGVFCRYRNAYALENKGRLNTMEFLQVNMLLKFEIIWTRIDQVIRL